MNNSAAILRALIIYAIVVPLAIVVGYMAVLMMNSPSSTTLGGFGLFLLALCIPIFLRWHYTLLLLCWSLPVTVFFLPGAPGVFLPMLAISLAVSLGQRALDKNMRFISVSQITWPLICLVAVVLVTAKLTGGIGLHSLGNEVMGGKKYVTLIAGILGYFALTACRIPPEKVRLYVALFLLARVVGAIGDLYPVMPSWLGPIFLLIPPSSYFTGVFEVGGTRLPGFGIGGLAIISWLCARYGLRGVFLSGKTWRMVLFFVSFVIMFLGGFRSLLLEFGGIFIMLFFLEGLHRTRILPFFLLTGLLSLILLVPLASQLPFTFQRTLAFLPLDISQEARLSAQDSTDWRIEMWKALLPQVPPHLLLGEGYAITAEDYQMIGPSAFRTIDPAEQSLALSRDYHNGPLSVILPFGIWGVITFLWLMFAGLQVMYRNFRYGDPALRTVNTFLWVHYIYTCIRFLFFGGGLASDIIYFTGDLGFSIALNGGMRRPELQPALEKQPSASAKILPSRLPVFHR